MSALKQKKEMTAAVPDVDFSSAREMTPYLVEPKAMYVGAPGKHGYLKLVFEPDVNGKSILREIDRRVPLICQQALYFDEYWPELPCVYILASGGPHVDGDRFRQDIIMRKGSNAFISTGAATKIAEMKHNYSGMVQNIIMEEDTYLEFMPEPTIPCRHARFICDTNIVIPESASLFYSEIYTGGRKYYKDGEEFAFDILSVCSHASRPDGTRLFREKFIIDPGVLDPRCLGIMGRYDVFGNVLVLTSADIAEEIYNKTPAFIDREKNIAAGITHLPNGAGLLFKVLALESGPVKKLIREFCSTVRQAAKGKPVMEEFPWR